MGKTIKHSKSWYFNAKLIAYWVGMAFCVLPPLIAGIVKLPSIVVQKNAESTLSGVFVLAIICAAVPIYKAVIKLVKSPNAAVICWILFGLIALVDTMSPQTISALKAVFAFAAIGNTIGAICFKLSAMFDDLWKHCGQVDIVSGGINNA